MHKNLAIIGSTGSIGTQTLDIVDRYPDRFTVEVLSANNNVALLVSQVRKYQPNVVVIANKDKYPQLSDALQDEPVKVYAGEEALGQVMAMETVDVVVAAMVGYAGLHPVAEAIKAGKTIALANKETLVVAGALIQELLLKHKAALVPVDSEHSAILQCLVGEAGNPVEKITLTASGGPFRNYTREQMGNITKHQALKHPNWCMGPKITIDSASMMNKGLEVIEARWLFDLPADKIEVIIHPQSIIHSLVHFADGSVKAQMGLPDMRLPILYALTYPGRVPSDLPRFDFAACEQLTFEQVDYKKFRNLALAFEALKKGGNQTCVLNAANEVLVEAFLQERVRFAEMPGVIEKTMQKVPFIPKPGLDELQESDRMGRQLAKELIH